MEENKDSQEVVKLKFKDLNPISAIDYGIRNLINYQDPPYDKLWRIGLLGIYNLVLIDGLSKGLQRLIFH